tara:strand:- start:698 stop:1093 length:396 start_codon:yes stop_codon:yes gene_type:complete
MGRYYDGDIEGKFWFGLQPSDDADFFGVQGQRGNRHFFYSFLEENKKDVENGLNTCAINLSATKPHLDTFFGEPRAYNNKEISNHLQKNMGWTYSEDEVLNLLTWYARHNLGTEILGSINKTGACFFTAER